MLGDAHNRTGVAAPEGPVTPVWAPPDRPSGDLGDAFSGGDDAVGTADGGADRSVIHRRDAAGWAGDGLDGRGWTDEAPPGEPPPLPLRLGEMSVTDLLDGAWAVLTCRLRTVLGLSAAIVIPAEVAVSLLVSRPLQKGNITDVLKRMLPYAHLYPAPDASTADVTRSVIAVALMSLAIFVLGAAIGKLVAAWYADVDLTAGAVLGTVLRRSPALLAGWLVMGTGELLVAGTCNWIALFILPLFLLMAPLITVERRGAIGALRRSFSLVSKRYFGVLVLSGLALLVERLVTFALLVLIELAAAISPESVARVLQSGGWAMVSFVTAPVVVAVPALLYIDLRVRSEGLDLEVQADEVLPDGVPDR